MAVFAASRLHLAGFASEREYDEGVYLLSARAVAAGEHLFSQVFSSQPPAFLESLALMMRVTGDTLAHAQAFSLFWALLAMAAVADLARRLQSPVASPLAAAALAVGATFTDLAHMVQAEVPSLALGLLSIDMALRSRARRWSSGGIMVAGLLFGAALLFKLFVAPLALPFAFVLALAPADDSDPRWRLDLRGFLPRAALAAAAGAVVVALPLLRYDAAALYEQTVAFHLAKYAAYRATPTGNLIRVWGMVADNPVVSLAAASGLAILARRNRVAAWWLGSWVLAMVLVLRGQTPLFWRHLVLLAPPLSILAGAALARAVAGLPGMVRAGAMLGAIALMLAPAAISPAHPRALVPTIPHPDWMPWPGGPLRSAATAGTLVEAANWIRSHTTADELVGGDDPIVVYLAGRRAPSALCDTSQARIVSGSLTLDAATAHSAPARVIVLREDGRLTKLEGYSAWMMQNYDAQDPRLTGLDRRRSVWVRKGDARPGQ